MTELGAQSGPSGRSLSWLCCPSRRSLASRPDKFHSTTLGDRALVFAWGAKSARDDASLAIAGLWAVEAAIGLLA